MNIFSKIFLRIKVSLSVLFRYKHFVIVKITDSNLRKMLQEKEFDASFEYLGLQEYNAWKLIKEVSTVQDEISMILAKAKFEAEAELKAREN